MRFCAIDRTHSNRHGLASVYWTWYTIDHERKAVKVHYCPGCYESEARPLVLADLACNPDERYEFCMSCHEQIAGDGALVYGKAFVPGQEPQPFETWYCFPHFDEQRALLAKIGQPLPDRQAVTAAPASSPWARLDSLVPAS